MKRLLEAGCQEDQPCDQRVGTFGSHPLISGEGVGRGGWRLNQSPTANDLINHAYIMKPP